MFSCEICELFKNTFFYRTFPVAASENNEQQQLSEGFANICYKKFHQFFYKNSLTILPSASTIVEHFYLLKIATILEIRTIYFKRWNFLLVARWSLLFARCSLRFARYFLLVARYVLLVARQEILKDFVFSKSKQKVLHMNLHKKFNLWRTWKLG